MVAASLTNPFPWKTPTAQGKAASGLMADVTQILSQIERGDPSAADQLLPLVYDELRKLAAQKMSRERPEHTLQGTALVHEAYLRLVGAEGGQDWKNRAHFFGAAAEAMRRILVEHARGKGRLKRGANSERQTYRLATSSVPVKRNELLAVDAALENLEAKNPTAATLVKLRYFSGFTNAEAAQLVGVSPRKADQIWSYARTFLLAEIENE